MRLVLYTGKGGVGKTTTAAATAVRAAELGVRTLVASTDAAHSLGDVLGHRLGPRPVAVSPTLDAVEIDPRHEMARHWGSIREYLVELFRHQGIESVVAEELALLPGAEELASLLAVEDHAAGGDYELVVVDCAPTGSTLRLLSLPDILTGAMRLLPGVLRAVAKVLTPAARLVVDAPLPRSRVFAEAQELVERRARRLRERLQSDETSVRIVVTPERMVVDEGRRAFMELSLFEIACDAVVLNRMLPEEAVRGEFFRDAASAQRERRREVAEGFAPLPVLEGPLQRDEVVGLDALSAHGRMLFAEQLPHALLATPQRLAIERREGGYRLRLALPGATPEQLEVATVEGDLIVRAGTRRRAIPLPPRVVPLRLAGARLAEGELTVTFEREPSSDQ